jgi:chorismate synthase
LLAEFGVDLAAHVIQIGAVIAKADDVASNDIRKRSMKSPVRCCDKQASSKMVEQIRKAKRDKDSLGGIVETRAWGLPPGLGTFTQWDRKIDARIAQAMMSIQAVKGVEIGIGFRGAGRPGSKFHDEIVYTGEKRVGGPYRRLSNNLGGTEGSMTTGEELVVRVMKKPISTLMRPLRSVNMATREPALAVLERSDTCAVPALAIIVESALAIVLAEFFIEKFGGDTVNEMKRNFDAYVAAVQRR